MNTTLTLTLGISILINILTISWAYREYATRRRYQQETLVLRQVLHGDHPACRNRGDGFAQLIAWLIIGMFLVALIRWAGG